jgi:hypothetical protein
VARLSAQPAGARCQPGRRRAPELGRALVAAPGVARRSGALPVLVRGRGRRRRAPRGGLPPRLPPVAPPRPRFGPPARSPARGRPFGRPLPRL